MVKFSYKDQMWADQFYYGRDLGGGAKKFRCMSCGAEVEAPGRMGDPLILGGMFAPGEVSREILRKIQIEVHLSWHSVKYSIPCLKCGEEAVYEVGLYCPLATDEDVRTLRRCKGPLCAWYNKCSRENHVAKKEEQDKVWIGTNGMIYKGEVKELKNHGH